MRKIIFLILIPCYIFAGSKLFVKESKNFRVIYTKNLSDITDYILKHSENSLYKISKFFNYEPSQKISIFLNDIYDHGNARATSVPENLIKIAVAPNEIGYESLLYTERIKWVISHELVHIVINDQASDIEAFFRTLFSKVPPEQKHPISLYYSLLTNYSRYTPRWHQEAVAVFFETVLNGGFGRMVTSFDEMYFRSLVLEKKEFSSEIELETYTTHNSFLLGKLFYLYGTRFSIYLIDKYGIEKFINWYKVDKANFYQSVFSKFEEIFGIEFGSAWENYIKYEKDFQYRNIAKLKEVEETKFNYILNEPLGWVSKPIKMRDEIIFAYHKPHKLASISKLNLAERSIDDIHTQPTPSILQVTSLAVNEDKGILLYTVNNNQLFRDVCLYDLETKEDSVLFGNSRIGEITIDKEGNLWGIRNNNGISQLVFSDYPYKRLALIKSFDFGVEIHQLAASPKKTELAFVLHKSDGSQKIAVINYGKILQGKSVIPKIVYEEGSPENPSWSIDGRFIYFNAYTTGVSNIFKYNNETDSLVLVSNSYKGVFRPVELKVGSIFAFEFSSEGFVPVTFSEDNRKEARAISYLGNKIFEKYPQLLNLTVSSRDSVYQSVKPGEEREYVGINNLNVNSFLPIITGFQHQKVLGFYTHLSDLSNRNNLIFEFGYSPFNERANQPKFHIKASWEIDKKWMLSYNYNAADFYDLFNDRKKGLIGSRFSLSYTNYSVYDNPLKIMQKFSVDYYDGIKFWNDNSTLVRQPDFLISSFVYNYKYLRKSIGSSNYEKGIQFDTKVFAFMYDPEDFKYSLKLYTQVNNYNTWLMNHNVLHIMGAAGYLYNPDDLIQARFFFGGFGNRKLDNDVAKQYRKLFRFPGFPIYSIIADRFGKILLENNFPPIRAKNISLVQQMLNHINYSVYAQALFSNSSVSKEIFSVGGQVDFVFKHWYNIESTLSLGAAKGFYNGTENNEWFISFKLMKN